MYWKDFSYRTIIVLLVFIAFLWACENPKSTDKKLPEADKELTLEEEMSEKRIIRQIENELKISAAETYDYEIFYEYINSDTIKDAVILLNRKEAAIKHIQSSGSEAFFEKTGQTAAYNYVFVKLGGQKDIIPTTPVGSNVNYPLEIQFLELTSLAHTDFYVEYRIRNSVQRNYYTVRNNQIYLTFSCPVFDEIGEKEPIAYEIKHETSSVRFSKDIVLNYAKIKNYNPSQIEDINHYTPEEIIGTEEMYVFFIFDDKKMTYVTPMTAPESE